MATSVNIKRLRAVLVRGEWSVPAPYGPDGWYTKRVDGAGVIVTSARHEDGVEYLHASMACPGRVPDYEELTLLHRAVFGDGYAYQVFAPPEVHVNLHSFALHLFGRLDGQACMPEMSLQMGGVRSI
jgi:hypothetical protein